MTTNQAARGSNPLQRTTCTKSFRLFPPTVVFRAQLQSFAIGLAGPIGHPLAGAVRQEGCSSCRVNALGPKNPIQKFSVERKGVHPTRAIGPELCVVHAE